MATYKPGPFGPFTGKIGTVVGTKWKKLNVARGVPSKSGKPPVLAQLEQRAKFALITQFLSNHGDLINLGFQRPSGNVTPMNVAVKYHLQNAVTGIYPDYTIDYKRVLFSKGTGSIQNGYNLKMVQEADRVIQITWEIESFESKNTLPTDSIYIILYAPEINQFAAVFGGSPRSSLKRKMNVSRSFEGLKAHSWILFVSADQKQVSATQYMGEMTII